LRLLALAKVVLAELHATERWQMAKMVQAEQEVSGAGFRGMRATRRLFIA